MVLPVFYQLDPSQIHDLSGRYGEALSRHQEDCAPEEVESWRHASKEIANLKGWDSRVIKDETTLIKEIVSDIQKKLENAPSASIDAEGLVGMQSRVKHIESLLSFGSTGVLIVGIWGMGGIASLPESIGELKSLVELALRSCKKLASLPSSNGGLKSLVELKVYDCSELASLPESIGELKCLKRLDLDDCSKLASLPSSIGGLKSLVKLEVGRCSELASLPESIGELKCLEKLGLRFCKKLASLPSSIGGLKSLVKLGVGSVLKVPYDCSAVADLLYSLIIEARFENNRFQKPKKQPKTSSNHRSAIVSRPFKFPIPSLLSPLPQNLKKEHSNLSDQVKTAKDSFLGPPNIVDTLQKLGNEYELLRKKYLQELSDRKRLYNEVIELKGNIRVFCRCRPLNQVEITNGSNYVVEFDSSQDMKIISSDSSKKQFKFDHVFEPEDNQEAVFAQTKPIVASVLDGYNACIFAYGQTGTGKTFTMEGSPENRGVNYRTFLTGGDCKTLMFIQISPSATDLGETLCSLNFASRVRGIESGPARKQADLSELFKYKQMVEKKLQDSLQSLQLRLAATEHICRTLQEKVRELENKLGEGRKTRLKQETRAFAAAASQSTIQVVEKRKIDKKPPLCPSKLRMPLRKITSSMPPPSPPLQKQKNCSVLSSMYEKENNPRITTAGTNTKRLVKPRRMSVAIRPPPPMSAQIFQPKRRVSTATYRSEPTSNMTTPLQTSRYKMGIHLSGTHESQGTRSCSLRCQILDGYNACIFAYGQTGTGKTFTMEGSPENRGVNYRTLDELFRLSQERSGIMRYGLFVSMMEVYNEKIRDLLIESSNQPPKNFRGTDMQRNQIDAYIDNKLDGGEKLEPALLEKIEDSNISVVVFSENYADSTFCLRELSKIHECMETKGQMVLPVFHQLDPSQVQDLTGSYGEALSRHERDCASSEVESWRHALKEIADLKGWDSSVIKDETRLIEEIVSDIQKKFKNAPSASIDAEGLVGMQSRVKHIESLLSFGSTGVLIVGIWGMGGIELILSDFNFSNLPNLEVPNLDQLDLSFCTSLTCLPDIIGELKSLVKLDLRYCKKLASLPSSIGKLTCLVKLRLGDCCELASLPESIGELKSLVELDLHSCKKLASLPSSIGGLKSLVELTVRRCSKLASLPESIGELKCLKTLDLGYCSKLASLPNSIYGLESLKWLDHDVFLSFRGTDTRNSFTSHLHNALKQKQIDAFIDKQLDGGEKLEPALLKRIEDSYISVVIFSKNYARSTFCLRELSKIHECMKTKGQMVLPVFHQLDPSQIHDLSGRYGEALSRHQEDCAPEEVESWRHASKEIANLKGWDSRVINDFNFSNLPNLEVPNLDQLVELDLSFCTSLTCLPDIIGELKSLVKLDLRYCKKLASLPSSIGKLTCLVKLRLGDCCELASLPESIGELKSLVELDLHSCKKLASLPSSIGGLKSLVELTVRRCSKLASLPESIGELKCLKTLDLGYCSKLASLPNSIYGLESLKWLDVGDCGTDMQRNQIDAYIDNKLDGGEKLEPALLEKIEDSNISVVVFSENYANSTFCLRELSKIHECMETKGQMVLPVFHQLDPTQVQDLTGSYGEALSRHERDCASSEVESWRHALKEIANLKGWDSSGTGKVESIYLNVSEIKEINLSPEAFEGMYILRLLKFYNPPLLKLFGWNIMTSEERVRIHLPRGLHFLSNELRVLYWCYYPLKSLPSNFIPEKLLILSDFDFSNLPNLEVLNLEQCNLCTLPPSIGFLSQLIKLDLSSNRSLTCLPDRIGELKSLVSLDLQNCSKLASIPDSILILSDFDFYNLPNLEVLNLEQCNLCTLPSSIGFLSQLVKLDLSFCSSLTCLPDSIGELKSLVKLNLHCCIKLASLPSSIGKLTCLVKLNLSVCSELTSLPESIGELKSLVKLDLFCCLKLASPLHSICDLESLPEWFTYKNIGGPTVKFKLPAHLQLFGLTLCAVVSFGPGKSTTAEAVYNQNSHKFEGRCFFPNVREETKKHGIDHVRQEILREVLENKDIHTTVLTPDIKRMLQRKKVLIVLDDVKDPQHLKYLVGEDGLFGQGSRIIVTSRDWQVFVNPCQANRIYEVTELDEDDAHRLFSLHAFKQNNPPDGYTRLSKNMVSCVKGIPLVLEVLGASLYTKTSVEDWESKVAQLRTNRGEDIKKCLEMCYHELDRTEKKIFLDIACFFGRCTRDYLQQTLGLEERSGIDRLIDMCLIKIVQNKIWMHDVLLKLGRKIVVQENVDPRERSRLWDAKDVYRVLTTQIKQTAEGTQEVPGLVETRVTGTEDVWDLLKSGSRASLLRVTVKGENLINGQKTRSHLWMVDMAGSERVGKIDVEGERLKESQFINKSLSALGDVISALASKTGHIPYRNSKLTHILQSSLGGDCKTLMFVQISPSATDLGETLCSLNFTGRVRGIESGPARKQADLSELFKYKQMVEKLKHDEKETKKLQDSLQSLQLRLAATERICRTLQEKVRELENQLGEERKTRLKQETRAFAAAASQSTIQVVEKRKIDKKPPLCPSKFGCRCEKSPIPCLHHLLLYKNRKIVLFYLQCMKKKTIQESQLQEQIQKDLRISVAIRPPPPMSAQIFQPKRRVSTATYRSEPTSNMTTPLQTSRHKMGIFRGTDTRNSFTSHLHAALKQKQIDAYIDNKLDGGEKLEPALLEKIEDSYISVVIFSKNYADSTFCLRELSKILECMENKGQKVLPVFHQLDPSQVQDLTGSYGEALSRHERDCASEEVESWRHALKEIANLKGWDSSVIKDETRLIEEIVSDIQKKFKNAPSASIDAAGLVGMQSRVKHIESLLSFGSTSVLTVGIWGKSTTAEAVYNRNSHKFEGRCFFQDVREESKKNGVDHVRQEILGEDDLFGQGSRIIVTSRDKQVLINACQENRIYKVNELDEDDALRLFSIHAFKKNNPPDEYTMLSNIVVSCVKGIPLVLKVLGASLYKRTSVEYWKSKVAQLGKNGGGDIKKCLKMCYDELDRTEKKIFLDIACFFGRCKRDYLQRTLDLEERSGIDRLIDMCLIKIIENKIWMHDVLLKLGRDIVVHENVDPRKRSRLWDAKDVYRGTGKVESIYLDLSENKEIDLSPAAFEGMYNLRLLKFYYPPFLKTLSREQMMITGERVRIHLPQGLHFLSNELRILDWSYYPLKSLPSNFFPENLAVRLVCENHRLPCLLPSASFLIAFSFLFSPMTFSFPDFLITAHGGFKINKLPLNIWE
uniref:TIR domain-containing protein n=1 Tax=Salix viminalis TaxID=40686 RepID=A0A6N2KTI6_SALVM